MLLTTWMTVAGICALGAMSPGPSLAVVLNNTISHGRAAGIATAIGHGLGITFYALLTALGLALIIAGSPTLFMVIKYAGAGFLLWLAFKAFTAAADAAAADAASPAGTAPKVEKTGHGGFVSGLLIAVLNPKTVVFFLALFSQFVDANATLADKLLLAFTAGIIDTLWYLLVAWGIATGPVLAFLQRHQQALNRIFAVIIALLALSILLRG